jgi:hypothetical protein
MTNPVRLALVLHNHQPIGNFEGVFESAYRESYAPFLDVLREFPDIRVSLHNSGSLHVLEVDGKQFVYVVENGNRYVRREVKTANISIDEIRVLEGLKEGDRIVTKGAVLVKGQEVQGT